ncbi:MAG: prepilin-type N-terminal cleavage/methylation domain-containing protein [Magnetococcus sp. XQGC-1]
MEKIIQRTRQAGFTLIEISIVLIIVGLLLGGVLKGQTMVKNSKIKRIAADSQAFIASANSYVDSYWALPGDDTGTAARWSAGITAGDGSGLVGGETFPTATAGNEDLLAIGHLRCAELLKGSCAAAATLPRNSVGGVIGIVDGSGANDNVFGMDTKTICQSAIEFEYAQVYDTQFDDGVGTTGTIRGGSGGTVTAAASAYVTGATFIVCSGY